MDVAMLVCHCNAATDQDIRRSAAKGEGSVADVAHGCRAGTSCGACVPAIVAILQRMKNERPGMAARRPSKRGD